MSDTELADSIEAYAGLVFIGFKEPGTRAGVDDWGRVLVSPARADEGRAALQALGVTVLEEGVLAPTVIATVHRRLIPVIRSHPMVDYIEPVGRVEFENQDTTWNVHRVRAPEAWPTSIGSGVKLLIIDTGAPNGHPDLVPTVIQACDGSNGLDQQGHGTHVAGIAAATNNLVHIIGVSHGVQFWSSKTSFVASSVWCAVQFGRVNGVAVINMSFSTTETSALTDMIKGAYLDGIFIAKSAGNTNGGPVTYPGTLFETVAVTALDLFNVRASFAAVAPQVELAAPGVNIRSTSLPTGTACSQGGFTGLCSGTSMAAPHVAAAAAILKAANPSWTNADIRLRLQQTAIDLGPAGRDNQYGYGLIDIRAALDWQPPPPITVSISGPTLIRPGATCTWDAIISSGAAPFSYFWTGQIWPWGATTPSYTGGKDPGILYNQFTVRVDVTGSGNSTGWASITVTESAQAWPCLI